MCIYYFGIAITHTTSKLVSSTAVVIEQCLININVYSSLSYSPPFMYRNQCTSSLLTNYVSVFVYMYAAVLLNHLVQDVLVFLRNRCHDRSYGWKIFDFVCSDLYRATPVFFPPSFAAGVIANIAILLTFGSAFPPLALIILLSSSYSSWCTMLIVKEKFTAASERLISPVSPTYMWILIIFSSVFYALFIFDIVSDSVGAANGAWAPVLMACLPSLVTMAINCLVRLYNYRRYTNSKILAMSIFVRPSEPT